MSISMNRAMEILNDEKADITYQDLMFVLTVFRDNAKHDDVFEVLDTIVRREHEKSIPKKK